MTIGTALVVIAVLYLIDKYNLWRKAAVATAILAGVLGAGLLTWIGYDKWQRAKASQEQRIDGKKYTESQAPTPNIGFDKYATPWEPHAVDSREGRYTLDDIAACPPSGYVYVEKIGCNASPKTLPKDYFSNSGVNTKFACYDPTTGKLTPDFFERFGGKMTECPKGKSLVTKR